jgi:hypothetical protein
MDNLKGIAEVIEHILYELLGLFVPGSIFVLTIAGILGQPQWDLLLQFINNHPLLALLGAYVLGYPLQGISRPVTTVFQWLLLFPGRFVLFLVGCCSKRVRFWIQTRLDILKRKLTQRHTHHPVTDDDIVDLFELGHDYWTTRLNIPAGKRLSHRQVQDLSFSALLLERKHLDRFRAAASLARGVAVTVVVAFTLLLYQFIIGVRAPSTEIMIFLVGLAIVFYALMDRADMYDGLWHTILLPQFLCTITRDRTPKATVLTNSSHTESKENDGG